MKICAVPRLLAFTLCGVALWGSALSARAFTVNESSKLVVSDGSHGDVTNALAFVGRKAQDGWTVSLGSAGSTITWDYPITVDIPYVFTLKGADPNNRPKVISTYAGGMALFLIARPSKTVTLKDLHFAGWNTINSLIAIKGAGMDSFRLTNLKFTDSTKWSIWVGDLNSASLGEGPYGVIDNCSFLPPTGGAGIFIRENSSSASWRTPMSFGTRKAVFIEDCVFSTPTLAVGRGAIDGDHGARWVFRRNSLTNFTIGNHGNDSSGDGNSCLQFEVMHNTFTVTGDQAQDYCMFNRGGTGVMFSNVVTRTGNSGYNSVLKMAYFRAAPGNGVVSVDKHYPADYPGPQQPGSGVVGNVEGSVPVYFWGNNIQCGMWSGSAIAVGISAEDRAFMQLNRDYFDGVPKPGYVEFEYPHPLRNGKLGASILAPQRLRVASQ